MRYSLSIITVTFSFFQMKDVIELEFVLMWESERNIFKTERKQKSEINSLSRLN